MKVTRRQFTAAAASILALTPLGCTTLSDKSAKSEKKSLMDRMPWASSKDEAPEPYPNPVKIAATWTPDSLVQSGRTPTRGFGGRIFFYDERSRPVPVEGTLIVHGFDDQADSAESRVKRFEFTPEQFTRHFSQTDLGASYSVWIPWDAVGGEQRRISLVASFKTAEAKMVQGLPATLVLPGPAAKDAEATAVAKFSPQYREYLEATESGATRTSGLTTTTIPRRSAIRSKHPAEATKPGITIPTLQDPGTRIASGEATPSADLEMVKKASRGSAVMPASAEMPYRR
jgi:hypothetical protein